MIDIHTHILPGVDDGSPNMETSIKLLKEEINQGVTDVFVTPHYYKFRGFYSTSDENTVIFQQLVEEIKKHNMQINIYLGTEIYYDKNTIKNLNNKVVLPLGNTKFVLIEFSLCEESEDILEAINGITAKGYIPIIAHPERYPYIKSIDAYYYMRRMGAKIQINASSLIGNYGRKTKKFVLNLIKSNLVDFVASDMHDFRMVKLSEAYKVVEKTFSIEKANELFNNKSILN